MKKETITISSKKHKGVHRILIYFKYNESLKNIIKLKLNAFWSYSLKCWYMDLNQENINKIHNELSGNYKIIDNIQKKRDYSQKEKDFLNGFYKYLKGKRYSNSTVNTYVFFIADLVSFYKEKTPNKYTNRDIEVYIENIFIRRNYSISTQRQFISAVKQLAIYNPTCRINNLKLIRPKKSRKLPTILSKEEVLRLLKNIGNIKHKTIVALLYSSGLRISELLNLKINQLDFDRKQLLIKDAKGRKDRYVILAENMIPLLFNYHTNYKPKLYLFEGNNNQKYSASSVRKLLKRASDKALIGKDITPHTLRHSFATHLLENGISLRHIQELLGHSKPETTMIYTKVTQKDLLEIKSPLDKIVENYKEDNLEQKFLLSFKNKG